MPIYTIRFPSLFLKIPASTKYWSVQPRTLLAAIALILQRILSYLRKRWLIVQHMWKSKSLSYFHNLDVAWGERGWFGLTQNHINNYNEWGKVQKFKTSRPLFSLRNSHLKNLRAQSAPPLLGLKYLWSIFTCLHCCSKLDWCFPAWPRHMLI